MFQTFPDVTEGMIDTPHLFAKAWFSVCEACDLTSKLHKDSLFFII